MGVNALNGLLSFLQGNIKADGSEYIGVNALNGLLSFLLDRTTEISLALLNRCQRPKRAFIISTSTPYCQYDYGNIMCQRPKRAFIISTEEFL